MPRILCFLPSTRDAWSIAWRKARVEAIENSLSLYSSILCALLFVFSLCALSSAFLAPCGFFYPFSPQKRILGVRPHAHHSPPSILIAAGAQQRRSPAGAGGAQPAACARRRSARPATLRLEVSRDIARSSVRRKARSTRPVKPHSHPTAGIERGQDPMVSGLTGDMDPLTARRMTVELCLEISGVFRSKVNCILVQFVPAIVPLVRIN
jgi:hypothetical protein